MYKEGAVCFTEGTGNFLSFRSELPDVIMLCKTGIMPFKSAEGQIITNDPIV